MRRKIVDTGRLIAVCGLILFLFTPPAFGRWARTFGTDQGLTGVLVPSVVGGYYLAGYNESESSTAWNIARINSSGVVTWAKKLPGAGDNFSVAMEMADVLIYLCRLADRLDIDLLAAAGEKMELNGKKYPVEQARGRADKYTKYTGER